MMQDPFAALPTSGTFVAALSGPLINTNVNVRWARSSWNVALLFPQGLNTGSSSNTPVTIDLSAMPPFLLPAGGASICVPVRSNGTSQTVSGVMNIGPTTTWTVSYTYATSGFPSAAGVSGFEATIISYPIN